MEIIIVLWTAFGLTLGANVVDQYDIRLPDVKLSPRIECNEKRGCMEIRDGKMKQVPWPKKAPYVPHKANVDKTKAR